MTIVGGTGRGNAVSTESMAYAAGVEPNWLLDALDLEPHSIRCAIGFIELLKAEEDFREAAQGELPGPLMARYAAAIAKLEAWIIDAEPRDAAEAAMLLRYAQSLISSGDVPADLEVRLIGHVVTFLRDHMDA
jgi:hypothetical protein